MDSEVTLASVEAACDSRARAYAEYKRQEAADEHKNFELVKLSLSPRLYDTDLEGILEKCCKGTGGWILHEKSLQKWLDPDDQSTRSLWLVGMPGAGLKPPEQYEYQSDFRRKNFPVVHDH